MKLKKFEQMILEREGFDDIDQPLDRKPFIDEDDIDDDEWEDLDEEEEEEPEEYEGDDYGDDEDDDEDITHSDVIEHLVSSLRKMINMSFDNSYVFADEDGSINVQFIFGRTEKFETIMKAMNMLKKLATDTLIQYESEFDLWRTTKGFPIMTARFLYDEDVDSNQEVKPF